MEYYTNTNSISCKNGSIRDVGRYNYISTAISNMICLSSIFVLSVLGFSSGVLTEGASAPMAPPRSPADSGKTCTLTPIGDNNDDVPQILEAFEACNNGGTVVFPEDSTFYIATKLNPVIYDVTIDWRGTWLVRLGYRSTCDCGLRLLDRVVLTTVMVHSSRTIWTIGAQTHTQSPSRTTLPDLSFQGSEYISMAMEQAKSMAAVILGTRPRQAKHSLGDPCLLCSGTSLMFLSSTVS